MAYIQKNNPFPVTSCGRRRSFMNNNVRRQINSPGKDRTEESPFKNHSLVGYLFLLVLLLLLPLM